MQYARAHTGHATFAVCSNSGTSALNGDIFQKYLTSHLKNFIKKSIAQKLSAYYGSEDLYLGNIPK